MTLRLSSRTPWLWQGQENNPAIPTVPQTWGRILHEPRESVELGLVAKARRASPPICVKTLQNEIALSCVVLNSNHRPAVDHPNTRPMDVGLWQLSAISLQKLRIARQSGAEESGSLLLLERNGLFAHSIHAYGAGCFRERPASIRKRPHFTGDDDMVVLFSHREKYQLRALPTDCPPSLPPTRVSVRHLALETEFMMTA